MPPTTDPQPTRPDDPSYQPTGDAVRVSDADRERAVHVLGRFMADGTLTMAEGEQRIAAAYAARHRGDLAALVADLPFDRRELIAVTPHPTATAGPPSNPWQLIGAGVRMALQQWRTARVIIPLLMALLVLGVVVTGLAGLHEVLGHAGDHGGERFGGH